MISFQGSISVGGNSGDLLTVEITFDVPRLAFRQSEDVVDRLYAKRGVSATFEHPTGDTTYRVAVPGELLAEDSTEMRGLATQFFTTALEAGDLDAFALPVGVAYRSPDGQLLGISELSVLAVPRAAPRATERLSRLAFARAPLTDNMVVFDRAELLRLRAKVIDLDNDALLLRAVLGCTRLADGLFSFDEAGAQQVEAYLVGQDLDAAVIERLMTAIKDAHADLVGIELEVPVAETVEVAGILTISAPDDVTITAADFTAFEVTAEWVDAGDGRARTRSVGFTATTVVTDDSVTFDLTATAAVYRSSVRGDVRVNVRGMGGPLWTGSFKADDPELAALAITVARQVSGTLTTLEEPPIDPNLRLRGRVVDLHPSCARKDVLVLVQAKASAADTEWRVVGAATTDAAGNFSLPYPYGTFAAARAVCSVAPRNPASIPIVAATGVRTISDDFLYLLVEHGPTEDDPCGLAECECTDRKTPGRLPDFEDLIGSELYTQDLGTGCINLSTPNRTINEHNFQAIVRTSDPDVATYQLSRHELGLDEIDIAQVAALVSGAAVLRERATAAAGVAASLSPTANNQTLLTAVMAAHTRAGEVTEALPSSALPFQRIDPSSLTQPKADLGEVISILETARNQLVMTGGNLGPVAEALLVAARALKALLDRDPDFFEADYAQKVVNAARTLTFRADAARDSVRLNDQAPPRSAQALRTAVQSIEPHVQSVAGALAQGGPPITLSALSKVYTHLDAVTSVLNVAVAELTRDGLGAPAALRAVADAAQTLKPLVDHAIDTAGTSVRYELTNASSTRTRLPVGLTNPIEWRRAPEAVGGQTSTALTTFEAFLEQALAPARSTEPVDPEAEFAQAVSVATGHILHYKVVFKADGYSLGDVVYSLPLAPGQKKEIVVFDSSQTLLGAEAQQLTQNERLAMGLVDERDITNQLTGTLSETVRGSSIANTSGISAGFGTGGQGSGGGQGYGGSGSAVLGVAGGVAQAGSSARQDSSRDVAQFFGEKLRQSIMQNAEGYRSLNASVVTTVQQGQRYAVTSEVIANHNHCHSLTMLYFEVLRHYALFQELASVEECVFVPLLLARFSVDNMTAWRDVLAPALLPMPSETYLQPFVAMAGSVREHPLIKGFDAVQRLRTSYANVDMPAGSYDEEPIRFVKGSMQLRVNLPRPKTRYDRIKSLPIVNRVQAPNPSSVIKSTSTAAILAGLTGGLSLMFTGPGIEEPKVVQAKEQIFDAFMSMDANFESVPPARCIRVNNFRPVGLIFNGNTYQPHAPDLFEDGKRDKEQWEQYSRLLGYTDVIDMMEYYFRGRLIAEWDDIFYNDIVPLVFDRLVDSLRLSDFATDVTALRRYNGGEQRITVNISGTTNKSRRQLPQQLTLTAAAASAQALRSYVTLNVEELTLNYSTAHYNGPLYAGSLGDDLLDDVKLDIPMRPDEQRNPRREDRYLAAALVEHLNSNLEHYNRVLWTRLDPDRRYMLLDGFAIQVYDAAGLPVLASDGGLRSLASVVKNEVITVAGNSLVLPVAPGYRVSGALIQQKGPDGKPTEVSLFDHYKPLTPVKPYRVSVPTRGVFVEAVQGQCNACEKIETDRLQDWTRFPIDEPTAIAPINVPTPVPQDWQAAWREFAQPMVNIQNAPGMPAPGAGLAGLADALTTSGVFKDITGLDANQQNVMRTYLSNQENAKAFAEMAKDMAMQSHNTANSGKIMDTISAAQRSGTITPTAAGQLVKDHLQQQIDGGKSKDATLTAGGSHLATVTADAVRSGTPVDATQTFRDGTLATLRQLGTAPGAGLFDFTVPGVIHPLKQDPSKDNTCWAVVIAMMRAWKVGATAPVTVASEIAKIDGPYAGLYTNNQKLVTADKKDLFARLGLVIDPIGLSSATPAQYLRLMQEYGPLWATVDSDLTKETSEHAKLLYGIHGDGTATGTMLRIIDPRAGTRIEATFESFTREFEQLARTESPVAINGQIARFAKPIAGEGASGATVYDLLTNAARVASMGLTANPAAKLLPIPIGTDPYGFFHHWSEGWTGKTVVSSTGLTTTELEYPLEHEMGGSSMRMPFRVIDRLEWKNAHVKFGADTFPLPLTRRFLLAEDRGNAPLIIDEDSSNWFPLEATLQSHLTLLFGYVVDVGTGVVTPLDLTNAPADGLDTWLRNGATSAATSTNRRVVLALYDLTMHAPANDFQPKQGAPIGPAMTARLYPLLSVWCANACDEAAADFTMTRPATSAMTEAMMPGSAIRGSFYTDSNDEIRSVWEDTDPDVQDILLAASVHPLLSGPIAGAVAAFHFLPSPRWNSIFAHYKLASDLQEKVVVDRAKPVRPNATARKQWDPSTSSYLPTTVIKVAGQGAFDNIHIAPEMAYKGAVASMAPICQHDCLHLHWRWGEKFSDRYLHGWSGGRPYAKPGAPMIPENQNLTVSLTGTTFTYRPVASRVEAMTWQVFMHHGMAYATELTIVGMALPMIDITSGAELTSLPSWEKVYYHNRFWETGATRADDTPRLEEGAGQSNFVPLEDM